METPSDIPAIGRDPDAFEAFYREHLPWVRRFVARRVDDPHAAADLTADIFLAVVDSAAGYREDLGAQDGFDSRRVRTHFGLVAGDPAPR